ncbi:MAG: hypothetical protein QNK04_09515 [Myxococcota bacterium]|nr:hypothetical protein [Myxococcota bacterium]
MSTSSENGRGRTVGFVALKLHCEDRMLPLARYFKKLLGSRAPSGS